MFGLNRLFGENDLNADLFNGVKAGDLTVVQTAILKGADVNVKNPQGITALMMAVFNGNWKCVELLLNKGADPNAKDANYITALMMAAVSGNLKIIDSLLDAGAAVNAKAADNRTALMYAIVNSHEDVVMHLIRKGADVNAKASDNGGTALMGAAWTGHAGITSHLLNSGADCSAKMFNGATALDIARERGHNFVMGLITAPSLNDLLGRSSRPKETPRTVRVTHVNFGVTNPRQYLEIPEGSSVGIAVLNEFIEATKEQVRQWQLSRRNIAELSEEQIAKEFIRQPAKLGSSDLFNDATPQELIGDAVKKFGVSPVTKIMDLPSNNMYRQRAAHAALILYTAWEIEMDDAALKACNRELFDSIQKNTSFVEFHSEVFKPSINRKKVEMDELAFSSEV